MRNHLGSALVLTIFTVATAGCSSPPSNTDACRELLNIQSDFAELVGDIPADSGQIRAILPMFATIIDRTEQINATGDVEISTTALASAASDWHDALDSAVQDGSLDETTTSSLVATYVDADVDVRNTCSKFLP